MKDSKNYSGEPESLHEIKNDLGKKSVDGFVNPGTPENPMVGMEDRKTGQIGGSASERLRARLSPSANDSSSMSKKSGNDGRLSGGK